MLVLPFDKAQESQQAQYTAGHYNVSSLSLSKDRREDQATTALLSRIKTKPPTIGNSPIVQIEESTISKMETVQLNQSYKDSVCSIMEHTDKNKLKVGGCPSTGSGTVTLNELCRGFMNGVRVNG